MHIIVPKKTVQLLENHLIKVVRNFDDQYYLRNQCAFDILPDLEIGSFILAMD
jgi:hypothetical protein